MKLTKKNVIDIKNRVYENCSICKKELLKNDIKVRDHDHLIKNSDSKAVLSVNTRGLDKYREERERLLKLSSVLDRTDKLEDDVTEIKNMLKQLLERR